MGYIQQIKKKVWNAGQRKWEDVVGYTNDGDGYCTCSLCLKQRKKEKEKEKEKELHVPDKLFEL